MANQPPANPDKQDDAAGAASGNNYISVGNLHYHGNDLTELRKIAEVNPALAEAIVHQRDRENARENTSFRLGFLATVALVMTAIAALTFMVVFAGVIASICAIAGILAIALLMRVILTGEWSDTSWFGKWITGLVRLLGGTPDPAEKSDN